MGKSNRKVGGKELHELLRRVFRLGNSLQTIADRIHEKSGISTPQTRVMRTLVRRGPATVPQMAALLDVSRQFVQKTCNELQRLSLLEFRDNPRHRKSKLAVLTNAGEKVFQSAKKKEELLIGQLMPELDFDEVATCNDLLKHLSVSLDRLYMD